MGYLTPIPFIASFVSSASCGWIMDKFFDKKEKYLIALSGAGTAFFLFLMLQAETIATVVIFQCGVYFFKSTIMALTVGLTLKVVTGAIAGSASALVNMGGQVAGFLSPAFMGFLYAFNGSFTAVFYYLITMGTLCAVFALSIKRRTEDSAEA